MRVSDFNRTPPEIVEFVFRSVIVVTAGPKRFGGRDLWSMLVGAGVVAVYAIIALLLLRGWGQPDPWSRIDVFAGIGLVFNGVLAAPSRARSGVAAFPAT